MKFDELFEKVINASKAFEDRQVPIHLDFKIEDLRGALVEANDTIEKLVGAKKSAEQILRNLLDCGLIKEWYFNGKFNAVLKAGDPHLQIAELKQKLEDAKATAYTESVDAGMENRMLKRALWIARAKRAIEKIAWFKLWNTSISTMNPEDGARQEYDKWQKNLGKFLAKAEEYK